ncbi:23054_t:CDS:2 [Rhizophagus irregularis]|nr:23054_t:CDS:2 [Rhizophagus irregularis]
MFEYHISTPLLKALYSSFMFIVAQGMAKVNSNLKLLTLNPMFKHLKREQNRMKDVATEFAVEGETAREFTAIVY